MIQLDKEAWADVLIATCLAEGVSPDEVIAVAQPCVEVFDRHHQRVDNLVFFLLRDGSFLTMQMIQGVNANSILMPAPGRLQ